MLDAKAKGRGSAELGVKVTRKSGAVETYKGEAIVEYKPVYVVIECAEVDGKLMPQKKIVIQADDAGAAFSGKLVEQLRG